MPTFVRPICFGQKNVCDETVKTRTNYKNSGFSGNCPTTKMTFFFQKGFFDMGEKVGFTKCIFEKLCSSKIVVFSKHSSCNKKNCRLQNRKVMKIVACF